MSIEGLRSVPLDILKRLEAVPEAYLQELGEDHDLFAELPASVQRQVPLAAACLTHSALTHIAYLLCCSVPCGSWIAAVYTEQLDVGLLM